MISKIKLLFKSIVDRVVFYQKSKRATIIGDNVYFHRKSRISLIEGASRSNITIDSNSRLFGTLSCCSKGTIKIGRYSQVGQNSCIRSVNEVVIGSYTAIADNVVVCDNNNHPVNPLDRHIMRQTPSGSKERSWTNSDNAPIIIGDDCWIGQYSRICKGVTIGNGSVVAANSVVTKSVPENCIVAGNPAKIVKTDIDVIVKRFFHHRDGENNKK
ncbi:MAG: acyltransferase [Muribaculaceae bacterium]|nr:acyltransferase [Muribaculaceae bacterium]